MLLSVIYETQLKGCGFRLPLTSRSLFLALFISPRVVGVRVFVCASEHVYVVSRGCIYTKQRVNQVPSVPCDF